MSASHIDLKASFNDVWQTIGPTLEAHDAAFDQTIRPAPPSYQDLLSHISLPTLDLTKDGHRKAEISLGTTLGQGGMGIVRLSQQIPLNREVAVKSLRTDKASPESTYRLLQEAWVTGLLEHPNIIPVHQLGQNAEGQPLMVMKRIEGTSWRDILKGDASLPKQLQGAADDLEQQLNILLQVCNAVEFAHSKGIIHRDIKPENVMIGHHGEVYLVDWGLALDVKGARPYLPQIKDAKGIAGTPYYMAPEMAAGRSEQLSEATDVYLLGATLHELITGHPPHLGTSLQDVLFQAFSSIPREYGEAVPEELASICRRAMQLSPGERYPTAEAFREHLVHFLQHRQSLRISAEAHDSFVQMSALIDTEQHLPLALLPTGDLSQELAQTEVMSRPESPIMDPKAAPDPGTQLQMYTLFGQCRFGFEEALRIWPENAQAQRGLQASMEAMAEFELTQGSAQAAAVLIAQLPEPRPALETRLAELQETLAEEEQEYEALKQFQHEHDLTVGAQARSIHVFLFGLITCLLCVGVGLSERMNLYTPQHAHIIIDFIILFVLSAVLLYVKRDILMQNTVSRQIASAFLLFLFTIVLFEVLAMRLGIPVKQAFVIGMLMMFVTEGTLALIIDWRLIGPALLHGLASIWGSWHIHNIYFVVGIALLVSYSWIATIWSPEIATGKHIKQLDLHLRQLAEKKKEVKQKLLATSLGKRACAAKRSSPEST